MNDPQQAVEFQKEQNHVKTFHRAKHVLSEIKRTPRMQRQTEPYGSELDLLCAFARVIFLPFP
jgi:hypothetical protein